MRRRGRRRSKSADAAEDKKEDAQEDAPVDGAQDGASEQQAPQDGEKDQSDDKDSPEIMKKEGLLAQLFEWEGEGYDTSALETAVHENDPNIESMFNEFSNNVKELLEVVKKMEEIEVDERFMDDIQRIRELMNNPSKVAEIKEELKKLESSSSMQKYADDLDSMNTGGLEAEVEAIKALIGDEANIPEIERLMKDLKRRVKEKFFESEIALAFTPKPKKKVKKIKIVKTKMGMTAQPFKIHDIFMFHHNGELVSHHTRRADLAANKASLANMLKVIQGNIKSPKRKEIRRIEFENYRILFQDGNNVTVAATITGGERNEMFLLMKKVTDLVENKFSDDLSSFDGDVSKLKGVDKYMAALIQVFIKMELKAQAKQKAASQ